MSGDGPPVLRACTFATLAGASVAAIGMILFAFWESAGLDFGFLILAAVATFFVAFIIGGLHLLVLGLPLYFLLRRVARIGWAESSAAGFLVGAIPIALYEGASGRGGLMMTIAVCGVPGLAAGLAFGLTLDRHARRLTARQHEEIFS